MSVYHVVNACRRDWRVRDHARNLVRDPCAARLFFLGHY